MAPAADPSRLSSTIIAGTSACLGSGVITTSAKPLPPGCSRVWRNTPEPRNWPAPPYRTTHFRRCGSTRICFKRERTRRLPPPCRLARSRCRSTIGVKSQWP
jgi:hypothetical protein